VRLPPRLHPAEAEHRGTMAAGLRELKLELRCTICDKVSSYVIYATRGIQFPTYRGGNDRGKAGDERAARAAFNTGGDAVWQCSGSKDSSGSGGVGGVPPPRDESAWEALTRRDQWRWMARRWRLGIGLNPHEVGL
jgi:hypothetical protein